MTIDLRGARAVVFPGTGSDDRYVVQAFAEPLRAAGAELTAPAPQPTRLIAGYTDAMDEAARRGPIVVGGVSLGAAVSLAWALRHPERTVAVLAALPAWTGAPGDATAALAAQVSARQLREDGLEATTAQMRASSPPWLADELARSWLGQWPYLPEAMVEAAGYVAPTRVEIGRLAVPLGVAAALDDPIHPVDVGREWAATAPRAALRTLTLAQVGTNPSALGAACLAAAVEAAARG